MTNAALRIGIGTYHWGELHARQGRVMPIMINQQWTRGAGSKRLWLLVTLALLPLLLLTTLVGVSLFRPVVLRAGAHRLVFTLYAPPERRLSQYERYLRRAYPGRHLCIRIGTESAYVVAVD